MHLQVRGIELHEAWIYHLSRDSSGRSKKGQFPQLGTLTLCICNILFEAILDCFYHTRSPVINTDATCQKASYPVEGDHRHMVASNSTAAVNFI